MGGKHEIPQGGVSPPPESSKRPGSGAPVDRIGQRLTNDVAGNPQREREARERIGRIRGGRRG